MSAKPKRPEEVAEILAALKAQEPSLPVGITAAMNDLHEKRTAMKTWFDGQKKKGADGKWDGVSLNCTMEEYQKRESELAALTDNFKATVDPFIRDFEREQEAKFLEAIGKPQRGNLAFGENGNDRPVPVKSLYQHLEGNDEFKQLLEGGIPSNPSFSRRIVLKDVDMKSIFAAKGVKATFDTATGYPMPLNRGPEVVPFARRRPVVADFIASTPWGEQYYVYMENTTWTNAAATVAEGAAKPESTLAYTQRSVKVEVIAHILPVTKQALKFGPDLENEIDSQMQDMLALVEEQQLLYGTGTSPQLTGITTRAGIQTTARTTETNLDVIFKVMQDIRFLGFASPNVMFLNPANVTPIVLLKDTLNRYIYGDPASLQLGTFWGVPYVQTPIVTAGTAVIGDFAMWARLLRAGEVAVELGYVNDDFSKNKVTMRAEEFIALQVRRPAAFGTATNLS